MGRKNSSGQALPCLPACGAGIQPQTSSKLSPLLGTACMLPLPKLIWPPTNPSDSHSCPLLFAGGREDAGRECFKLSVWHSEAWPSADSNCWLKAAIAGSPLFPSNCHRLQFYFLKCNSWLIIISCFSSCLTFKEMHRNLIISFLVFVLPAPYPPFNIL